MFAGASAIESLLERMPDPGLRIFIVWEPVLPTDWSAPGRGVMARVPDPRVTQFWDQDRKLSAVLGGPAQLAQIAAVNDIRFAMKNVIWDAVLVFRKRESKPAFIGAPVFQVAADIPRWIADGHH